MTKNLRVKNSKFIDETYRISFKFNGTKYYGFKGDTLASALLANDIHLVGRSFKYHRPRGIMTAGSEEPNAIIQLHNNSSRTVLKIPSILAPYKAAILPLVKKDGLSEIATDLYNKLKTEFNIIYDAKDAVGRRYRRQDAIGTPLCITVDHQTLDDKSVTIRNRDTMKQERITIKEVSKEITKEVILKNWL